MSVVGWILLGAIVGLVANVLMPGRFPYGAVGTVGFGTLGAALGGLIFAAIAGRGVAGLDLLSLLIALIGAALLLVVMRSVGPGETRAQGTGV